MARDGSAHTTSPDTGDGPWVDLEGCYNFRDLGGLRAEEFGTVVHSRLFRSDSLHALSTADLTRVRDVLGVRLVVDLRSATELADRGAWPFTHEFVRLHLPLAPITLDATRDTRDASALSGLVAAAYGAALEQVGDSLAAAVRGLNQFSAPAVVFCGSGKDRTGIACAAILGAVGVMDDEIVADYALSDGSLARLLARRYPDAAGSRELPRLSPAEAMSEVLTGVRVRYASFAGYFEQHGLSAGDLGQLRRRLFDVAWP